MSEQIRIKGDESLSNLSKTVAALADDPLVQTQSHVQHLSQSCIPQHFLPDLKKGKKYDSRPVKSDEDETDVDIHVHHHTYSNSQLTDSDIKKITGKEHVIMVDIENKTSMFDTTNKEIGSLLSARDLLNIIFIIFCSDTLRTFLTEKANTCLSSMNIIWKSVPDKKCGQNVADDRIISMSYNLHEQLPIDIKLSILSGDRDFCYSQFPGRKFSVVSPHSRHNYSISEICHDLLNPPEPIEECEEMRILKRKCPEAGTLMFRHGNLTGLCEDNAVNMGFLSEPVALSDSRIGHAIEEVNNGYCIKSFVNLREESGSSKQVEKAIKNNNKIMVNSSLFRMKSWVFHLHNVLKDTPNIVFEIYCPKENDLAEEEIRNGCCSRQVFITRTN